MGIFDGVLLASDFDGTLATDDKRIAPDVRAAIKGFISDGGRFTVCTGRTHAGFHSYDPTIMNAPALLAGGGLAYDYVNDRVVIDDGIGDEGVAAMAAVRDNFPDAAIEMYPLYGAAVINLQETSQRHFTGLGIKFTQVDDPTQVPRPWSKAFICAPAKTVGAIQAFLTRNFPQINFVPTDGCFLEILKKGCNKGTMLLKLADMLGIDHKDVYAAGDGGNDVDMLRVVSMAFVPQNADASAKACATYIVRSNEEGCVANAIEILRDKYSKQSAADKK